MHIAYKYVHDDEMKSQTATPDMAVALKKDINIDHSKNYANVIAQRPFNTRRNSLNKDSFIKKMSLLIFHVKRHVLRLHYRSTIAVINESYDSESGPR